MAWRSQLCITAQRSGRAHSLGSNLGHDERVVKTRFSSAEWLGLTNAERVKRCRQLAVEARKLSRSASLHKERFANLAFEWEMLAEAIEREPDQQAA